MIAGAAQISWTRSKTVLAIIMMASCVGALGIEDLDRQRYVRNGQSFEEDDDQLFSDVGKHAMLTRESFFVSAD